MIARALGMALALAALLVAIGLIAIMVYSSLVRVEWPDERAERRAALAAAEAAQREAEEKLAHVNAMEQAEGFDGLVMFNQQTLEPQGYEVSTGVRYVSAFEPVWTFAWCTLQLPSSGAEDRNLVLGRKNPGAPVMSPPLDEARFARDNLSRADVERARELCRWPDDGDGATAGAAAAMAGRG
jgi:Na+-transporting methylmalonyl-CoA/oxaloacetate decarboxylase gamma subunit